MMVNILFLNFLVFFFTDLFSIPRHLQDHCFYIDQWMSLNGSLKIKGTTQVNLNIFSKEYREQVNPTVLSSIYEMSNRMYMIFISALKLNDFSFTFHVAFPMGCFTFLPKLPDDR